MDKEQIISDNDRLPEVDDIVLSARNKAYKLISVIGEGGYGSVFLAKCENDEKLVALKAEKFSKTVLKIEIEALQVANRRHCKHICKIYDYGHVKQEFMFVVMSLLGPDLNKLRNRQPNRHFTLPTSIRIAIQTLNAIEELHQCGFLSRDIKPGNFAIGNKADHQHHCIFIFDFGLARRYINRNLEVLPSRGEMGWRGTTRYGSLNAHHRQDLSRRDDLESWLYMIVEFTKGSLPWRFLTDRLLVQTAKENARTTTKKHFLKIIIDKLQFDETPPYATFHNILNEIADENGIELTMRYDWDDSISSITSSSNVISIGQSSSKSHKAENIQQDHPSYHDLSIQL
ncbi:CK1/WORM6 protein kinase [Loa loa]|uniref:CK1/WORM6 protein kinase n=1 Tax=Loa loa TaxID=7209 RepID=A0A1S0TQ54_LOALO|nr:CK1/WORM6 protein kinase [Loa loa]EFO18269.1 CK1/WORM6 protein kinase [Loa loa]